MTSDGAVGSRTVSTSSRPGANVASICFLSSYGRRTYSMRRTGAWRTDREQAKRACWRRAAGKWQAPGLRREDHSGAGNQEAVAGIRWLRLRAGQGRGEFDRRAAGQAGHNQEGRPEVVSDVLPEGIPASPVENDRLNICRVRPEARAVVDEP